MGSGCMASSTVGQIYLKYPVTMRTRPTITQNNMNVGIGTAAAAVSNLTGSVAGVDSAFLNCNLAAAIGAGTNGAIFYTPAADSFVAGDAEL